MSAPRKRTPAPVPWFGGKARIASRILPLLPPHSHYVEPFGGAASILLGKAPSSVEVYNDLNSGLVSLFRVLSDPSLFRDFWGRVLMLPHSREIWADCHATWADQVDQVEKAARFYVTVRQSFGGDAHSYGSTVQESCRGVAGSVSQWQGALTALPSIHARFSQVLIEHSDWRRILDRFRGPGWLTYVDPPYVPETRRSGRYDHELSRADHVELIAALLSYDGAVVLSGYPSDVYAPLETAGWHRTEIEWQSTVSGRTTASRRKGRDAVRTANKRTECIWRNPEALRRLSET